jgi:hypothetical protein
MHGAAFANYAAMTATPDRGGLTLMTVAGVEFARNALRIAHLTSTARSGQVKRVQWSPVGLWRRR